MFRHVHCVFFVSVNGYEEMSVYDFYNSMKLIINGLLSQ